MAPSLSACCSSAAWYVFDYTTPKLVTIRSLRVGLANRIVQAAILAYVIGYVIVYRKGYQDTDIAESAVTTKLKGVSSSLNRSDLPKHYRRIWDPADYHIPPQENNAFFVLTNAIISESQTQGICPEDPLVLLSYCNSSLHCEHGRILGNGVQTGHCNLTTDTCEINAWCPVQKDELQYRLPASLVSLLSSTISSFQANTETSSTYQQCREFYCAHQELHHFPKVWKHETVRGRT